MQQLIKSRAVACGGGGGGGSAPPPPEFSEFCKIPKFCIVDENLVSLNLQATALKSYYT